jgi:hypothetical protein
VPIALALTISVALSACSKGRPTDARPSDRSVISSAEMREHNFRNVYEAVAALRSNWLVSRGSDSFNSPTGVKVYYDTAMLGGVETLRTIRPEGIAFVRFYDGISASARWGMDHAQGVIFVSSRPE